MKASLDLNSMKEFATSHVEKFVFGGVVLLLLWFAVQAVRTVGAGAPCTPDQMKTEAGAAENNIANTTWAEYLAAHPDLEARDYLKEAQPILKDVPLGPYPPPPGVVFNPPVFEQRGPRDAPTLIALEGLRATAGNGALQMTADPGGVALARGARGSRWVAVTGLLPFREQAKEYDTAFQDAIFRDPQRDVPIYIGYVIERAEASLTAGGQQPNWKPIALQSAFGVLRHWGAASSREVVHAKFLPRQLPQRWPMVFPLPPRVNALWGDEAAHPPEIPLLADMPASERGLGYPGRYPGYGEGEEGEEGEEVTEGPEKVEGEGEGETEGPEGLQPFGPMVGPGVRGGGYPGGGPGPGYPGGGMPMMPGGPSGGAPMMPGPGGMYSGGMYPGPSTYEDEMDEGYGAGGMPYSGGMPYDPSGMRRPGSIARVEDVVEYQLFRFFDFDVEPGRRYQYRVRLGLLNPNYQVETRFLAKEDLGKEWWLATDWSEDSNVVKVPQDSRLLAGTVKPASSVLHEPSARVIAVTLRMEDGLETSEEYTVYRGHLANFESKIVQERASPYGPGGGMPGGYDELMGAPMYPPGYGGEDEGPRRPPRRTTADEEEEEAETINHATGLVVLDMVGGDRLHRSDRSLTEPASLLLLDPDGNLLVQDELDDSEEFAVFHVPEEPKRPARKKRRAGEGMYPGMPDEMGDMYEEMMGGAGMYGEGPTPRRGRGRRSRRAYDEE